MFELDAEMADLVRRLDKGAADIMVTDDAEIEGNAGLLCIADGGGGAAVGHGDDQVRRDRVFSCQLPSDILAHVIDRASLNHAVGTGEVNMLEYAEALGRRREGEMGADTGLINDHHFAG